MTQKYTRRLEEIEAELDRWLPAEAGLDWAAGIFPDLGGELGVEHFQALAAPGKDLISRGGKRWRPLLMTLVCETFGGGDAALPLAPLVEFCHNASLIHDDIEDNSDERRGGPAVHIAYGVDTAINTGCFLYFLALACIDTWAAGLPGRYELSAEKAQACKADLYSLWAGYLRKLHLGQAVDIRWHRDAGIIPSLEEYYAMCKLKTGCLARFAAELGVFAAGAVSRAPAEARELYEAAEKLGVGYQILDDVKNLTGGIRGKKRGDDVVEGKKSLPMILYLQRYPEKKDQVLNCFHIARRGGVAMAEVEELIRVFYTAGVLTEADERGRALIEEARSVFAARADSLAGLIDLMI